MTWKRRLRCSGVNRIAYLEHETASKTGWGFATACVRCLLRSATAEQTARFQSSVCIAQDSGPAAPARPKLKLRKWGSSSFPYPPIKEFEYVWTPSLLAGGSRRDLWCRAPRRGLRQAGRHNGPHLQLERDGLHARLHQRPDRLAELRQLRHRLQDGPDLSVGHVRLQHGSTQLQRELRLLGQHPLRQLHDDV